MSEVATLTATKICTKCGENKPLDDFYACKGCKDGRQGSCKECVAVRHKVRYEDNKEEILAQNTAYRRKNAEKIVAQKQIYREANREQERNRARTWYEAYPERAAATNRRKRLGKFSLTSEKFDAILTAQDSCCACCRTDEPGGSGGFHVDHDHACCPSKKSCGECIRGLLCHKCNSGIGRLGDNLVGVEQGLAYLHRTNRLDLRITTIVSAGYISDATSQRRRDLRKHNVTPEQYDIILKTQDYKCACCSASAPGRGGKNFFVDHDHETGAVRGLLCHNCNIGIGLLGDNIEGLTAALDYLIRFEENKNTDVTTQTENNE